ncbi:LuxR family transcriptional regulator [Paeniglutamicibacter psychrophenolicus]|uniref:LuxR family transcriptional regulator n=1 Tax=Paeniglutamicibacter psychrophenolicus TaxID=257454 RepID=UPI0027863F72|nr:LuxR family transcriptional regulator [Paeniglutamicibacter psychrophenolicus]MDQ0092636.1 DNA-binding CsgD family transcriptional regulator [Paeniglutamicibacter psychrophenolicus]
MNTGEGYVFQDGSRLGSLLLGEPGSETEPRETASARLGRALAESTYAGVLIKGESGSGRRALADTAAQKYAPGRSHINVVGTRYGKGIDYGAILFLLAEAEVESDENSSIGAIMTGLTRYFNQQRKPPLVFIEHPDELDPLTGNLMSQLALHGSIFIVAICDNQHGLGADLDALMRSSKLLTIEVGPLSLPEAGAHMARMLGGPVSNLAAGTLWHAAEGNQSWLDALIRESVDTGVLRCMGGTWVFTGERVPLGGAVGQLAASRIARLSAEERRVMHILALQRHVPTGLLRHSFPDALDSLFAAGYIQASPTQAGTVRLASRMLRWSIRETSGVTYRLVDTYADAGAESEQAMLLAEPTDVTGARWVMRYDACEREVRRLVRGGRLDEAQRVVAEVHRKLRAEPGPARQSPEWGAMNSDMLLLRSALAGRSGDTAGQSRLAGELLGAKGASSRACLSDSQRYLITAQMAEAEALGHGQDKAVRLVGQVLAEIRENGSGRGGEPAVAARHVPALVRSLLGALVAAGAWTQARELAQSILSGSCPHPEAIAMAGTWEGLLALLDADTQTALPYLETSMRQLEATGDEGELHLVGSALALCRAESGQTAEAAVLLHDRPDSSKSPDRGAGPTLGMLFRSLAGAYIGTPQATLERTRELAVLAGEVESPMLRMLAFGLAAQLGCEDGPALLAAAASTVQGRLADGTRLLADGVILEDPATVATGLRILVEAGYSRMAMPQHNTFAAMLTMPDRRQLAHIVLEHRRARARWRPHPVDGVPRHSQFGDVAELGLLTQRERDIAAAVVEGLSNLEIAKRSAVSIRTVEGHLYQVYAKLRVKGRRELVTHISTLGRGDAESSR